MRASSAAVRTATWEGAAGDADRAPVDRREPEEEEASAGSRLFSEIFSNPWEEVARSLEPFLEYPKRDSSTLLDLDTVLYVDRVMVPPPGCGTGGRGREARRVSVICMRRKSMTRWGGVPRRA